MMQRAVLSRFKKPCLLALALMFFFLLTSLEVAGNTPVAVHDLAGLLSPEQGQALEETAQDIYERRALRLFFLTITDAKGKSSRRYASDFLEGKTEAHEDAAVFLLDMDHREINLVTQGEAIDRITDAKEEALYDLAMTPLQAKDYAGMAQSVFARIDRYFEGEIPQENYRVSEETLKKERRLRVMDLLMGGVLSLFGGGAYYGSQRKQYRFHPKTPRYALHKNTRFHFAPHDDPLLDTKTRVRHIPRPRPSASGGSRGRSTVFRSSGGRTHGGGKGRGF